MFKVNIYIAVDSANTRKDKRSYGYRISCESRRGERTAEGEGEIDGTYHEASLAAINSALGRLNQSCEVFMHCEDRFVLNMINANLERWAGNDFKTAKGRPVENEAEWRELWRLTRGQLIRTKIGGNKHIDKIKEKIGGSKERKNGRNDVSEKDRRKEAQEA